jgi:hypothetical protein
VLIELTKLIKVLDHNKILEKSPNG